MHDQNTILQPKIAVILPCHNEAISIVATIEAFKKHLPQAEIWVIDNCSSDQSATLAQKAGAHVLFEERQGKGFAVRKAFQVIESDVYVLADGDGTYDAEAAPKLIDTLLGNHYQMVVGSRKPAQGATNAYRPAHSFGNWALTTIVRLLFGVGFNDMLSGYRVFSRSMVKSIALESHGFEIETELAVHCLTLELSCCEIETRYFERLQGSISKLNTWQDGWKILMMIIKLLRNKRPMLFFNSISVILASLAIILFIPIWDYYQQTGLVLRYPTFFLCGFLSLAAMGSTACGIIVEQITRARLEAKKLAWLRACDQNTPNPPLKP
ncbi:MAG: glycosyltransferase [Pseudomonadota bacterium]